VWASPPWSRRRLLLLAETITAEEAERWGFLERVVSLEALDAAVDEWVALICEAGPIAIANQKALIRQWEDLPMSQAIAAGITAFARSFETKEPNEMMGHFLSRKR
jgi:enoyl-CoA hydratase